jgi:branched-chain amino acid transport system permease protein
MLAFCVILLASCSACTLGDVGAGKAALGQTRITVTAFEPIQQPAPPHPVATLIQLIVFGLSNGSVLALNAIGITIIYSTVRTLNLAHGDVFALTTVLVTSLVNAVGIHPDWPVGQLAGALLLVLAASIFLAALISLGVEQLAFRPFRRTSRLAPLIATLGLSFILFQGALVWRTFQKSWIPGEHRSVPGLPEVPTDGIPTLLPELNLAARIGIPNLVIRFSDVFVFFLAVLFVVAASYFLYQTRTGRGIQALAQNPQLAQIIGVHIDGTIRRAFAVGGAFAGAAAFIFALYYSRPFGQHGAQSGLLAFTAAIIGGIGSPVGALLGALAMSVFSSLSDYYLSAQWTPVLLLALLIILLLWRPTGLGVTRDGSIEAIPARDSALLTSTLPNPHSRVWTVVFLVLLGMFPVFAALFRSGGLLILTTVQIFILLTLGLNLTLGISGLLDLGYAAGFGVGAYTAALLGKVDFIVAIFFGMVAGSLVGFLKGGLTRRVRGDYLAVATLTLGLLLRQIVINLPRSVGGAGGLNGFSAFQFLGLNIGQPAGKYYLVFGFVVLAVVTSRRLLGSRLGRALKASSEDETAALAAGVDVDRVRLAALVLSSALAGLAGALYAEAFSYVDPETMSFHVSSLVLTMIILGGAGNVPGAVAAAAAIILYDKVLIPHLADWAALIWPSGLSIGSAPDIRGASYFNFGIILYLTVLIRARWRGKRAP